MLRLDADLAVRLTVRRAGEPDSSGRCVVYWMQRAQRATDNPALETAIAAANELGVPVVVFFGPMPSFPGANYRHFHFMMQGLADTAERLEARGIGLVLRRLDEGGLAAFCLEAHAALVVSDENPMREPERWRASLAGELRVPFWTVDSDVVVPSALLEREHYSARTIRPKLRAHLERFLVRAKDRRVRVSWHPPRGMKSLAPRVETLDQMPLDRSVQPAPGVAGGTTEGLRCLRKFLREGLPGYSARRNRPEVEGTSRLSAYLHFGQLGPRAVALAVSAAHAPGVDREAFLEELIVRRELSVNFVKFNPRYDRLQGCEAWALRTLAAHARDPREHHYSGRQLEDAVTHDPLWNAAQRQMVRTGWMHGYMRMYWAKKILEWTRSPEGAFEIAVRLNDRYQLDGRDCNGYAGVAWAVGGKHDRPWGPERPIFGLVRYMNAAGCSRKFDTKAYIRAM
ncbi:MAG: deoxyribodipyrimidine photo-lyase [Candidatus Eisenbacteria bacterium]|nr:deoxyribodipyrimidine photo-lyase [Candidatus Eisenbacteria bacterium]